MADFTFTATDHSAVTSATKILCSRYRGFVEYEDIRQELYLWLLTNYDKAQRYRAKYEDKHAQRALVKALRHAGERYCRTEKAQWEGYGVDDEFFYTIPMVAKLLQAYFDPEWMVPASVDLESVSSGKPASEGGNLVAMVADTGRAYEGLTVADRDLLERVYGGSRPVEEAIDKEARRWGINYHAAQNRVRRAVGRVRANLGGPSPWNEDHE